MRLQFSTLPPSNPRACSPLERRSGLLLTRSLPIDSLHLHDLTANTHIFLLDHNRNRNRNHLRGSLSTHGLHILPHLASGHHHFLDVFTRFPQLLLTKVNCFSLEAIHTTVHAMISMLSQHGISPQLSCRPVEMFPAHVTDILPCSPALPFSFGVGGRMTVPTMILFIFSALVRQTCSILGPGPADQSFLHSSIARVVPHRGQWSRARRSLLPFHDAGRFQALHLRWSDRQEGF